MICCELPERLPQTRPFPRRQPFLGKCRKDGQAAGPEQLFQLCTRMNLAAHPFTGCCHCHAKAQTAERGQRKG